MSDTNLYDALFSEVLVFKTNILSHDDVEKLGRVLAPLSNIIQWNVDRNDVDRVLRIECDHLQPEAVISLVRNAGFECEELPD